MPLPLIIPLPFQSYLPRPTHPVSRSYLELVAYPNMTFAACCPHVLRGTDVDPSLPNHHAPSSSSSSSSARSHLNTGINDNYGINNGGINGGGSFAATTERGKAGRGTTGRGMTLFPSLIETKRRKHWRIFSDPVAHLPDIYVHEKTGVVQTGEPYDLRCHRLQRTMVREQWSWLDRSLW